MKRKAEESETYEKTEEFQGDNAERQPGAEFETPNYRPKKGRWHQFSGGR